MAVSEARIKKLERIVKALAERAYNKADLAKLYGKPGDDGDADKGPDATE